MTSGGRLGVVVGASAVVVALCVVAVTVKVLVSGVSVAQQRTFEREDLAARVVGEVLAQEDVSGMSGAPVCPSGVLIEEGVVFTCAMSITVGGRDGDRRVRFRVTDAAGGGFEFVEVLRPRR
jgi:hypothetical protein